MYLEIIIVRMNYECLQITSTKKLRVKVPVGWMVIDR
uniref:Uncharacterized protein n=1 Tax=Lepeophtheirus salmonis TaxID=72036 RepID=A0A0K2UK88_LEPSM